MSQILNNLLDQKLKLENDIKKVYKNIESNKNKIIELYKEIKTIKRGIRNRRKRNKNYNDLSLVLSEIKNAIEHYKKNIIILNTRILKFKNLEDNILLRIDKIKADDENIKTLENEILKTINNIDTVKKLVYKIKEELKKHDLPKSRKNKLQSKLLKQENNLKALHKTLNNLSSLLETRIKINHTGNKENNPFDFSDIKFDNNEIDLGEYLNIIENNIVKFENDDIRKVLENVTDEYPFILKGSLKINDNESSMINAFFTNRDALIERMEKINERYDESVPITFTGIVIKYTKSFNKIRRSYYGTGCDSFKKIVEYRGNLCYIPEENECFRKCLEYIYKKDFTEKYHDFIKNSKTTKNIMSSAKIQPFCKKYDINLGVYNINQQEILPRSVTERRLCLIIHENHFCVIWKTKETSFTNAIKELKENFKYEANQISDNILKQVQEYKFPISNEKDCLYAVFAFDLETANVDYKQYCVPYGAGGYHLNRLKECYNGNLSEDELKMERENVHIFDYKNKNPVMDMINFIVKNYKGKPKFFKNKDGEYKISCYKYQLIAHNASGFDNYIVLNYLPKTYFPKIIHTSRGILKLSFRVGTVYDNDK